MTKPREKTHEELTAEIEEGKKKIRQFENREKIIKQQLSVEERKARNHRLCKRGGFMESLLPELIAMPDEDAKAFLRLYLLHLPLIGGEKMNEYTFDYVERNWMGAFCKTVLRNEAINYLSELARRRDWEKSLDTLPQAEMDKLYTLDEYPSATAQRL